MIEARTQIGEGFNKELPPKKERLSDMEMGNLLSAVGNSEAKAALLLAMQRGIIYTMMDLHRALIERQGENVGWRIAASIPWEYCENSLSPIASVIKEVLEEGGERTYGYIKTDYGEKIGIPLAGLMLDFSRRYPNYSLYDFFGVTSSSSKLKKTEEGLEYKKRAPILRRRIFRELVTSPLPIQNLDLINRLQEAKGTVWRHLVDLKRKGVITYQAAEYGKPFAFFRLSPNPPSQQPPQYKGRPTLTNFVYQALKEDPSKEWTAEALVNLYQEEREASGQSKALSVAGLRSTISPILTHLEREGYAERRKFSQSKKSEINLSQEQRAMLFELVNILDRFQNQEPEIIKRGRELADYFSTQPDELSSLLQKAREHSPYANRTPPQETAELILYLIRLNPASDGNTIRQLLEEQGNKKLGRARILQILGSLVASGKLSPETEKDVKHYSITQTGRE